MTATQAPTPGLLDSESVKLLVKGDLLRVIDPRAVLDLEAVEAFDCEGHPDGFIKLMRRASHFRANRFAFIGRPDADGWMPWSGGENPVPGQRVDVEYDEGAGDSNKLSDDLPWAHVRGPDDIIAFRLAPPAPVEDEPEVRCVNAHDRCYEGGPCPYCEPTAPVEASGSELHPATANLVDRFATEMKSKLAKAEAKYGYRDNWSRPDWEDELTESLAEHIQKGDPRDVAAYCAFAWHHGWSTSDAAGYFAPALRPQPSGETRDAVIQVVSEGLSNEWKDWEIAERILALLSARPLALGGQQGEACRGCGHVGPVPKDRIACCPDGKRHDTTPARAEAQDEGAAGSDAVSHHAKTDADPVVSMLRDVAERLERPEPDLLGARVGVQAVRLAVSSRLLTHPSPTPAADADRVRIAVELINAEINAPLTGPTHGAWDRGRIAGLKEALAALKSSEVEKMSAQRRDLIKRLAKAECGSRELDKAIFEATSPPAEYAEWSPRLRGYQYTTSIDAALSWAEWVLPGQEWRFGSGTRDTTLPWARIGRWAEPDAVGATPALAICGAILIALNRAEIEATRSPSATLAALKSTAAKEGGE